MDLSATTQAALASILRQVLNGEYGALSLLPGHASQVPDEESKRQLQRIEKLTLRQAARIGQLLGELEGKPPVRPPKTPTRPLLKEMLDLQIRGAKKEIAIYQRALKDRAGDELKTVLLPLQREAQGLLRLLQRLAETL